MKQALQDGFGDPGASYTRFRKQTIKKPEAFDLDFQIQLPQSTRRMLKQGSFERIDDHR